ncbi:MAG: hypothetical protein AAFX58_02165 [Pseudomonadota bacterium]
MNSSRDVRARPIACSGVRGGVGPLILTALIAAGCSGLLVSDEPPQRTYWLEPLAPVPLDRPVRVNTDAAPGLDSDRILALSAERELVPYAGARWSWPAAELMGSLLERSVNGDSAESTTQVRMYLHEFFVLRNAPGSTDKAVVAIGLTLQNGGACRFRAAEPVAGRRLADIVAAMQAATTAVLREAAATLRDGCPG